MRRIVETVVPLLFFCTIGIKGYCQDIRYNDAALFTLSGKKDSLGPIFHRVDTLAYPLMPKPVKRLFTNSAGLAICFQTDSPEIWVKWVVDSKTMGNMSPVGHSGLDLYIKKENKWLYAGTGVPTGNVNEKCIVKNMSENLKECVLYLPIYNELKRLEIGVKGLSKIQAIPNPFKKKIVVYGTSITQGASASRPGLAYPARLSRSLGYQFINLGLSGNGKMHKEVADMLADIQADAYILDCMPNMSITEIKERTSYLVNLIRSKHPWAPIIMVEAPVSEKANFDLAVQTGSKNKASTYFGEYQKLKKSVDFLYYIRCEYLTGENHEGTIDGVHPTDEGFSSMVDKLEKPLIKILQHHGI